MLTGEHGVGVEKRDLMPTMFNEIDLEQQQRVKCAFDPTIGSTPARCFPLCNAVRNSAGCTFTKGNLPFPHLPRF